MPGLGKVGRRYGGSTRLMGAALEVFAVTLRVLADIDCDGVTDVRAINNH
jgi:hypothetical protein